MAILSSFILKGDSPHLSVQCVGQVRRAERGGKRALQRGELLGLAGGDPRRGVQDLAHQRVGRVFGDQPVVILQPVPPRPPQGHVENLSVRARVRQVTLGLAYLVTCLLGWHSGQSLMPGRGAGKGWRVQRETRQMRRWVARPL